MTAETSTERVRQWRANNRDKVIAYRHGTRAKDNEASRRYYAKNREARIARAIEWKRENPDKVKEYATKRNRMLTERTPKWISRSELRVIYRKCPVGLNVDHIVPLWGLTADGYEVHGLHVPWNLQYLTAAENVQKGNRMRPRDHYAFDVTNPGYSAIIQKLRKTQRVPRET